MVKIASSSNQSSAAFKPGLLVALLTAASFLLLSLASSFAAPRDYPYRITATVGMVADIARNVAGDKAEVKAIMGPGVDPHLYKPTRDDVDAMMRSDVVLYSGLMLEGKMTDVLRKLARSKPVHAVAAAIAEERLLRPEGSGGHPDPHVWMDPSMWAEATEATGRLLALYDPTNAQHYQRNAATFAAACRQLHEYGRKVLSSIPERKRVLISSHDAFGYFGRAFGIRVLGVQGISTESEAGLRRINELADLIVNNGVEAVFVESSVPRRNIEALVQGVRARGHRLQIGGELFSDAMGPAGTYEGTYIGMLDHNITRVATALGGLAPQTGMQGKLAKDN